MSCSWDAVTVPQATQHRNGRRIFPLYSDFGQSTTLRWEWKATSFLVTSATKCSTTSRHLRHKFTSLMSDTQPAVNPAVVFVIQQQSRIYTCHTFWSCLHCNNQLRFYASSKDTILYVILHKHLILYCYNVVTYTSDLGDCCKISPTQTNNLNAFGSLVNHQDILWGPPHVEVNCIAFNTDM